MTEATLAEVEAPKILDDEVPAEFDPAFQARLLSLSMRDTMFMQRVDGLLKPTYFENEAHAAMFSLAAEHFAKYRACPSDTIWPVLLKEARETKKLRKDMMDEVKTAAKRVLTEPLADRDFMIEKVCDFAKRAAIHKALLDAVGYAEKGDYARIDKDMRIALDVGTADDIGGIDYWEGIEERTEYRVAIATGVITRDGITTGYSDLDKYLYHKGWGRKELSVIMGAAKAGKSMSLGEFSKNASLAGLNVLYASCEVAGRIIADRTDANVSDTAVKALETSPHEVAERLKRRKAVGKIGKFIIHEFPSGTLKPSALRRLVQRYRNRGIIFDLIVPDYADIMQPEIYTGDRTEDMRTIYLDLRALAHEENAAVLTATQTNREGAKATTAKMTDIAEDFNKVRTADILLSINSTSEERAAGEARLFFAASRNSRDGFSLRIKQDREKMKFLTKILGEE